MTIPPRFSDASERPDDFNIPSYVSDPLFRQITKVVPAAGSDGKGFGKPSDLSEFSFGNSWAHEPDRTKPADWKFEASLPYQPHYLHRFDQSTLKEYEEQTPQGRQYTKQMQRMRDSWAQGERGKDTKSYMWGTQSDEDYHHMLGHQESHNSHINRLIPAFDDYLTAQEEFRPVAHAALIGMGPEPSQELTERVRNARIKVDTIFQKMHDHLHMTCYRGDEKGGPCGYWGIPRGAQYCDFCKYGNPTKRPGDIMKFAADNHEHDDDWFIPGSDFTPKAPKSQSQPESLEPARPRPQVDPSMIGQIENIPAGQHLEGAYGPAGEPMPGKRFIQVKEKTHQHQLSHWVQHQDLRQQFILNHDEFLKARKHYQDLEEIAGDNPDERQQVLLAHHREQLSSMIAPLHDLWHEIHAQFHAPCTECGAWNNERDSDSCDQCASGCPFCSESDPRKYSTKLAPRDKGWMRKAHRTAGNPVRLPRRRRETQPLWEPKPETVPEPQIVPVCPPNTTPVPQEEPGVPTPTHAPQEVPVETPAGRKASTWSVIEDWESRYMKIAEQGLDTLKAPTDEEIEDGPIVHQGASSWVKQAEGLASSNDQLYMDPMFTGDTRGPDVAIPSEVDMGTSTEALSKKSSWVMFADAQSDNTFQPSPNTSSPSSDSSGSGATTDTSTGQGSAIAPAAGIAQPHTMNLQDNSTPNSGTGSGGNNSSGGGSGGGGGGGLMDVAKGWASGHVMDKAYEWGKGKIKGLSSGSGEAAAGEGVAGEAVAGAGEAAVGGEAAAAGAGILDTALELAPLLLLASYNEED